jgi:hypothetical protein
VESKVEGTPEEVAAATKIQAVVRGKKGRAAKKKALIKKKKLEKKLEKEKKKAEEKAYEESLQDVSKLFKEGEGAYVHQDKRGCTDIPFLALFVFYWIGQLYLCYFAFANGDLDRLVLPRDTDGHSCGLKNELDSGQTLDLTAYQALYLPNPATPQLYQICVPKCPGDGSTGDCTGNLTHNYDTSAVAGALGGSTTAVGGLASSAVGCDTCPSRYTRESTCIAKGDCSNGEKDVSEEHCTERGACAGGCAAPYNCEGVSSNDCLYNQTQGANYLTETNYTYTAYTWTPYDWIYDENDGLIICAPPGTLNAPNDPDYRFDDKGKPAFDFVMASRKSWVSQEGPCWLPVFASQDIVFRCVPLLLADFSSPEAMESSLAGGKAAQYFQDVIDYWFVIPAGAVFALIAAFAWIIFLSKFAGHLIWFTVYSIEILLPVAGLVSFYQGGIVTSPVDIPPELQAKLDAAEAAGGGQELPYYEIGVGCFIAATVVTLIFCIFKTRIEISIGVIEEASDAFLGGCCAVHCDVAAHLSAEPSANFASGVQMCRSAYFSRSSRWLSPFQ